MRKQLIFFLVLTLLLISQPTFAQQDSTLLKFVKGITQVIDKRANDSGFRTVGKPSYVLMGEKQVRLDSLYKYNIKDIKSVTIQFDWPSMLYGLSSEFGVIILNQKRKETK